jgi:hypothetical protein
MGGNGRTALLRVPVLGVPRPPVDQGMVCLIRANMADKAGQEGPEGVGKRAFRQCSRHVTGEVVCVFTVRSVTGPGEVAVTGRTGKTDEEIQDVGKNGAQHQGMGMAQGCLSGPASPGRLGHAPCNEPMGDLLGHIPLSAT